MNQELKFLTLAQAAKALQVSKRTVLRLINRREIPAIKVGGQWRFRETEILRWAQEKERAFISIDHLTINP